MQLRRELEELERRISSIHELVKATLCALDKQNNGLLPPDSVFEVLRSLQAPVPDATLHKLCQMLVVATGVGHKMNYHLVFHERLADFALQHNLKQPCSSVGSLPPAPPRATAGDRSFTTLTGRNGELARESKKIALQQFEVLIAFCRSNGIVLDEELATRGKEGHTYSITKGHVWTGI